MRIFTERDRKDDASKGSRGDSGVTMVELLVSMGIFTMVLIVSLAATVAMSNQAVRVQVVGDTATQMRTVYQRLDKEVRYADAINPPGVAGGNIYVEYQVPSSATKGEELCVQWRYVTGSEELQRRTWTPGSDDDLSGWSTMVTDLRNDLSDGEQQPFAMHFAGVSGGKNYLRQGLDIYLDAGTTVAKSEVGSQLDVYMVARNSSAASVTNSGGNLVCLVEGAQRP